MREHIIRGSFSFLAAAVTLGMAQEWAAWSIEQRNLRKMLPAVVLTFFSLYEANKVWNRFEVVFGLEPWTR